MRYHYKKPDIYIPIYGETYICDHPVGYLRREKYIPLYGRPYIERGIIMKLMDIFKRQTEIIKKQNDIIRLFDDLDEQRNAIMAMNETLINAVNAIGGYDHIYG